MFGTEIISNESGRLSFGVLHCSRPKLGWQTKQYHNINSNVFAPQDFAKPAGTQKTLSLLSLEHTSLRCPRHVFTGFADAVTRYARNQKPAVLPLCERNRQESR